MTRLEMLRIVVGRAHENGFEFKRWYTRQLELPWITTEASLTLLNTQRRYYALVFSHEFACSFWKGGSEITFQVPAQTFQRTMPDGSTRTVARKAFIRRSARPEAWRYHLREMALAEEPLRYLRRYLHVEEEILELATGEPSAPVLLKPPPGDRAARPLAKPLPAKSLRQDFDELPAFLRRPYP